MRVAFHKMHGLGNDFVVIDARAEPVALTRGARVRLADRHTGIGCDQLVLLEPPGPGEGDVRARYFNPDGGEAGACGNAARCVALLLGGGRAGFALSIGTGGGLLRARVLDAGLVCVDMGRPGLGWREVPLAAAVDTLHLPIPGDPAACSMGNPHATFFALPDGEVRDPAAAGPAMERHALFPERANIGYARILAPDRMRLRVWERGAGLTRACGSGACAAVVNAARRGLTGRRVAVELDGGRLDVEWGADDGVRMTGPAARVFEGRVEIDAGW